MRVWKRWLVVLAIGAAAIGVAACDGDPEDPDQIEEQVDELEQDVRENTP
jgi:hypothetical protein